MIGPDGLQGCHAPVGMERYTGDGALGGCHGTRMTQGVHMDGEGDAYLVCMNVHKEVTHDTG